MKTNFTILVVLSIILATGCAETAKNTQTEQSASSSTKVTQEPQLYTAYNIWRMRSHNMKCINYKHGNNILPAGTRVEKVKIKWDDSLKKDMISFTTVHDNRNYNIYFTRNWHPGKTDEDYKNLMLTPKTFEELTEGMTENEIRAIQNGMVVNGMSKRAVLVSYGYPPEHRTRSLDSNVWLYWSNKFRNFPVTFPNRMDVEFEISELTILIEPGHNLLTGSFIANHLV